MGWLKEELPVLSADLQPWALREIVAAVLA